MKIDQLLESNESNDVGIFRLLDFLQRSHRRCRDSSNPETQSTSQKMCLYLSYIMAMRDTIHTTESMNSPLIPRHVLFEPTVRSCMDVVKKFAKMTEKDRNVNKRVKDRCKQLMNESDDVFDFQIEKLRKFFTRLSKLNEKVENGHPLVGIGLNVDDIDFLRKVQDNKNLHKTFLTKSKYSQLKQKLKKYYNVDDDQALITKITGDRSLTL